MAAALERAELIALIAEDTLDVFTVPLLLLQPTNSVAVNVEMVIMARLTGRRVPRLT